MVDKPIGSREPRGANMKQRAGVIEDFAKILENLRQETDASRTTLRLHLPDLDFHVDRIAAEALASGVNSLMNETSVDQRKSAAPGV